MTTPAEPTPPKATKADLEKARKIRQEINAPTTPSNMDRIIAAALAAEREACAKEIEELAPQPDGAPDDKFNPKSQIPYLEAAAAIRARGK